MGSIKNDIDTIIKHTRKPGVCEICNFEVEELLEIDYVQYSFSPEYMTPIGRSQDKVCDNCFDEEY
ncbi:hypothetical protein LCGC14_1723210 [marine sediment metagenome]|uniref:Uncharacterized protein n=1 Tax=marine sediment metagenome TaxID=412755 RepID=A0A0F9HZH3_9ZZZZ